MFPLYCNNFTTIKLKYQQQKSKFYFARVSIYLKNDFGVTFIRSTKAFFNICG